MSTLSNNIWTVQPYVYKATSSGVDIFDYETTNLLNHIPYATGVSSVWANDTYLYFGTTNSGVYRTTVSGLSTSVYKQYPDLLSNNVLYLHGNTDHIAIATASGVDSYTISADTRISTVVSGTVYKCYQTAGQEHYFIVNSSDIMFGGVYFPVYNWTYVKHIELDGPIPEDGYQYYITLALDDVYNNCSGYDLRIIQDSGHPAPYIYDTFESGSDVELIALLDKDVTDVYIIYGFEDVPAYTGTEEDIFVFYDSFDYDDLPEDTWEFVASEHAINNGATCIFENGTIKIRSAVNEYVGIKTVESFRECSRIDMKFRKYVWSSNGTDMDFVYGFYSSNYYANIGPVAFYEEHLHRLMKAGAEKSPGVAPLVNDFKVGSIKIGENHQISIYDGETLTSYDTVTPGNNFIFATGLGNTISYPDIEIDWIRIGKYSSDEPGYTEHSTVLMSETSFFTELHAIYSDSSSYVYTSGLNSIIKSSHINDIHVTEGTSQYGTGNILFLGTDLGAVVIEERRGNELNCNFKYYRLDT